MTILSFLCKKHHTETPGMTDLLGAFVNYTDTHFSFFTQCFSVTFNWKIPFSRDNCSCYINL